MAYLGKIRWVVLVLLAGLLAWQPVGVGRAAGELSESSLVFKGRVGEILQRSFVLTPTQPLTQVHVVVSDLVDADGAVILGGKVAVEPASVDEVSELQRFEVLIADTSRAGSYRGELRITAAEQDFSLPVELTLSATPSVDTDVNSKSLTLYVEPGWGDWLSPAGAGADAPVIGEVGLSLVQNGETPALVSGLRVLALHGSEGRTLPEGTVQVTTSAPFEIAGSDAATVYLQARGRGLRAGEYNGTLLVVVENQPQPVQTPLKVLVKDGPLLALLLLAFGPIVGVLFAYWRNNGQALFDARRRLLDLQNRIRSGRDLTLEDQRNARQALELAMAALVRGDTTVVAEKCVEIERILAEAQEHAAAMAAQIETELAQIRSLELGTGFRDHLIAEMTQMQRDLGAGRIESRKALDNKMGVMAVQARYLLDANVKYQAGKVNPEMMPDLNRATTYEAFKAAFSRDLAPAKNIEGGLEAEQGGLLPEWRWFSLQLELGRLAVGVVVYLFTLAVGWVTFYSTAPTFGANREDYITLFLWGVASNAVGGQVLDLKAIFAARNETVPAQAENT